MDTATTGSDNQYGTFDQWKKQVDLEVARRVMVGCDDLPDVDYYSMYVDATDPVEAAEYVIQYAMEN